MERQGRVPPHNLEAEENLIGAVLMDDQALIKIGDLVRPEDFYKDAHRIIYGTILELFDRHEPIDLLTLGNRLEEKEQLKQIGGRSALINFTNTITTAAHVAHYAEIVAKKSSITPHD
jgi:replicative DNA helicase